MLHQVFAQELEQTSSPSQILGQKHYLSHQTQIQDLDHQHGLHQSIWHVMRTRCMFCFQRSMWKLCICRWYFHGWSGQTRSHLYRTPRFRLQNKTRIHRVFNELLRQRISVHLWVNFKRATQFYSPLITKWVCIRRSTIYHALSYS